MSFVEIASLKLIENLIPGFNVRFAHTPNVTLAFWEITAGHTLPVHSHHHEQTAIVLDGEFELTIDGDSQCLTSGSIGVIPSNAVHSGRAITDCRLLDIFFPVREDYLLKS